MPKKKMNTRGVLKVDGMSDFNPEANLQVTRSTHSASLKNQKDQTKKSGGCCGGKEKSS